VNPVNPVNPVKILLAGLCPPAQGCEARATLGQSAGKPNLEEVAAGLISKRFKAFQTRNWHCWQLAIGNRQSAIGNALLRAFPVQ
jgi:hypothetical protein